MTIREILQKLASTTIIPSIRGQTSPAPETSIRPPQAKALTMTPISKSAPKPTLKPKVAFDFSNIRQELDASNQQAMAQVEEAKKKMLNQNTSQGLKQLGTQALLTGTNAASSSPEAARQTNQQLMRGSLGGALQAASAASTFAQNRQGVLNQASTAQKQLAQQSTTHNKFLDAIQKMVPQPAGK